MLATLAPPRRASVWTVVHLWSFLLLWAFWTPLVFYIVDRGLDDGPGHDRMVVISTLLSITSPLIGGISRGGQGCCMLISWQVAAFAAPFLLIGVVAQILPWPRHPIAQGMKYFLWVAGWVIWFASGIVPMGHAFS